MRIPQKFQERETRKKEKQAGRAFLAMAIRLRRIMMDGEQQYRDGGGGHGGWVGGWVAGVVGLFGAAMQHIGPISI
jgi:hypothetical protein